MVNIYLPVIYYHLNMAVTEDSLLAVAVFRCPSGLSCLNGKTGKFPFPCCDCAVNTHAAKVELEVSNNTFG